MDNIRVLHLHTKYREPGGEDAVVDRERKYLTAQGYELETADFLNPTTRGKAAVSLAASLWNPSSHRRVRRLMGDVEPDLAHVHNTWFDASWSVLDAIGPDCPTVMTIHNYRQVCLNAYLFREGKACTSCLDGSLATGVRNACYRGSRLSSAVLASNLTIHRRLRTVPRNVSRLLVLSDFAGQLLVDHAGLPADAISRIDNAAPDPGIRPAPPGASDAVLAVGRLSEEKGFDVLIEAWRKSPATNGLRLRILGDGPEGDRLRSMAAGDPSISFEGRTDAAGVRAAMLSSRFLVVPSLWFEGQPLVVVEAFAAGLPVIALPQPPLVELLAGAGQTIAAEVDAGALADAFIVMQDEGVDGLGARARRRFELRHHPNVVGRELEAIYRSMLPAA